MPRYLKQPDKFGCGPVAVMNAFKWAGFVFSYREARDWFYAESECNRPDGSSPRLLDRGLRSINKKLGSPLRILRRYRVTKPELDRRLDQGEAAILLTGRTCLLYNVPCPNREPDEFWGHYIFCPSRSGKIYTVVNDARQSDRKHLAVYRASAKRMRRLLRRYSAERALEWYAKRCVYPTAWFLEQVKEIR
jgi:hypothetical protein